MNLSDAIQQLFTEVQDVAQVIAPVTAVIGLGVLRGSEAVFQQIKMSASHNFISPFWMLSGISCP